MRNIVTIILTAAGLCSAPVVAFSDQLTVGSCPSEISLEKKGEWTGVRNDEEIVQTLQANPDRARDVAAVYVIEDGSELEVSVISLGSLERHQGRIDEDDFNMIADAMAEAFKGPSPELQEKIDEVVRGNLSGTGLSASQQKYEPVIRTPGKLIGFALSEVEIPGEGLRYYETAMKMRHIRGCVVQANFAILVSPGSRARLEQAIEDFEME